jgi:hypothetical protein
MIDWNGYGWIAGEVTGPSTWFGDLTLEVPRGDVLAAAAVTEASVRVEEPEPGSVAVYVREYAQYDSAGKRTRIDGMKRLASHLTWWQMLPHKSTPRSTPQKGEASHGPYWHRCPQEGQPDLHPRRER